MSQKKGAVHLPAKEQAVLLILCAYNEQGIIAPSLVEWLYQQWMNQGRFLLEEVQDQEGPLNAQVAIATSHRAASRALLVEDWRLAGEDQRRELLDRLGDDESLLKECLASDPATTRELAETLALPCRLLVDHFGADHLLLLIEQEIRAVSSAFCSDLYGCSPEWEQRLSGAIRLLEKWPDTSVDNRISSLVLCPDLHVLVRYRLRDLLWERLWDQDRNQALTSAQEVASRASDSALAHRALLQIAREPHVDDRDFLLWATSQPEEPPFRYDGMQALERLGEDSSVWRERLNELSRDIDPLVRLQATAALARRGNSSRLDEVLHAAKEADDVFVRAEALQILGELDAERYIAFFRHALLEDHELLDGHYAPAAEEAAYVLARLGTTEALTSLIQGYLVAPHSVWTALCWYLDSIREQLDGRDTAVSLFFINWRQERFKRW